MYEQLLFRRQFLLGPNGLQAPAGWRTCAVGGTQTLAHHPELEVACFSAGDVAITSLGYVFDSLNPAATNAEVLGRLAGELRSFGDFESRIEPLAGRWIMIVRIGAQRRIYHDAVGSRAVHYAQQDGALWVASEPQLLAETLALRRDAALEQALMSAPHADWWPGDVTPYSQVRALLPNHYLDLDAQTVQRFWPKEPVAQWTVEAAAAELVKYWRGIFAAAHQRYRLRMAITGGRDGRVLLAGARPVFGDMTFFTIVNPKTPYEDIAVPRRVARTYGLDYRPIALQDSSPEFLAVFDRSVAGMVSGQCRTNAQMYLDYPPDTLFVEGTCSAAGLTPYYNSGVHPPQVNGETLARSSDFIGNPVAIEAFDRWLTTVPVPAPIPVLNLFYWEQRCGRWGALDYTAQELVRQVFSPYGCRRVLEILLGIPVAARTRPNNVIHRAICRLALPEIADLGFGWQARPRLVRLLDRAGIRVQSFFPPRLSHEAP